LLNILRQSERVSFIPFTERDISQDDEALAELEALGVMTTPVTVIDGQVVIGFDRAKLERLLAS
jgi:glutaredoxin